MENLYYLVMSMETWGQNDPRQFLHHYFVTEGAFTTSFLIALAIALIGLLVFYAWFGMTSNRLTSRTNWYVTLVIVGLVTFILTQLIVIGSEASLTGFFKDAANYAAEIRKTIPPDDPNQLKLFETQFIQIKGAMSDGCDVTWALNLWNTFISLVVYFFGSVIVKRWTNYGPAIPF